MLAYFKGYTIAICAIAVGLPLIVSTLWPIFTGSMMASTLWGLGAMFALFIMGMLIGFAIFNKVADSKVQRMLDAYNDDCDPQMLIEKGTNIAAQIGYPCNQPASWFMGYYGQALLDTGDAKGAKNALSGIRLSIDSAKKSSLKAGILVNYLPLCEKVEGIGEAIKVADEGIDLCSGASGANSEAYMDFLESQKKIFDALESSNPEDGIGVCEKIVANEDYPMRLRVEYSWIEASRLFGRNNPSKERSCLEFVVEHGGGLALVKAAKARLEQLG